MKSYGISQRSFKQTNNLCVVIHIRIKGEDGTMKLVSTFSNFLTDCSKAVLLLWIFCVICVCLGLLYCLFLATLWSFVGERSDLLTLLSHTVSLVRCGTRFYQFLIYAFSFTLFDSQGSYHTSHDV